MERNVLPNHPIIGLSGRSKLAGSLSSNDSFQVASRAVTMSGNGNVAALPVPSPQRMLYRCLPMPREYISCEKNSSSEKSIQKLSIHFPYLVLIFMVTADTIHCETCTRPVLNVFCTLVNNLACGAISKLIFHVLLGSTPPQYECGRMKPLLRLQHLSGGNMINYKASINKHRWPNVCALLKCWHTIQM